MHKLIVIIILLAAIHGCIQATLGSIKIEEYSQQVQEELNVTQN
jgi:hypothetical protein